MQDGSPTKILISHDSLDLEKDLRERLKLESISPTDSDTNTLSTDHLDVEDAPSEATTSIATSTSKGFLLNIFFFICYQHYYLCSLFSMLYSHKEKNI